MKFVDNLRVSLKLPALVALSAAVAAFVVGGLAFLDARQVLLEAREDELSAIVEIRASQLNADFEAISTDVAEAARSPLTFGALQDLATGWSALGGKQTETLQRLYVRDNPHPIGRKQDLDDAGDGSAYSAAHARRHPRLRTYLEARGYYDLFLFDPDGNVVYTVFKEVDFATNVVTGPWRDRGLGHAFRDALDADRPVFADFEPYPPSVDAPAGFVAAPIRRSDGTVAGVIAVQLPIDRINGVMNDSAGLGATGETVLVGGEGLMRSSSRFSRTSTILKTRLDDTATKAALAGATGHGSIEVDGRPALVSYAPFDALGVRWALLATMDEDEVLAPVLAMQWRILLATIAVLLAVAAFGVIFSRRITRPIGRLSEAMRRLDRGDTASPIPDRERRDELGTMARALETLRLGRIEAMRLAGERDADTAARLQRVAAREARCNAFDVAIGTMLQNVARATGTLSSSATQMSHVASETSARADHMSSASADASGTIQSVAGAAEQLATSIATLRDDVARAGTATRAAADDVARASGEIEGLLKASNEIGAVVEVIERVAAQTRLLALNATIEAARAGEAGRGFAVVATEVKSLAEETSRATERIESEVRTAQGLMRSAVQAVLAIGTTVGAATEAAGAITAAIEQQSGATADIGRNTVLSSERIVDLASDAANVHKVAEEAGRAAAELVSAARLVGEETRNMSQEIDRFLADLKAA